MIPFVAATMRLLWPEQLVLLGLSGWYLVGPTILVLVLVLGGVGGRLLLVVLRLQRLFHRSDRAPSTAVPAAGTAP
jgi:hypothetical protein